MRGPEISISTASRPSRLDDLPVAKRIGLIILATDHTTEVDFHRLVASERIGVYVTRIPYANPVTPENLIKMQPSLTAAAALILPGESLDVVMYSCTSASVVIGDARVEAAVQTAKPGVPVVTPTAAAVAGLKVLGAKRISILTPYTVETSRPMADYFANVGFEIDRVTCLDLSDDREMARIPHEEIVAFATEAMATESDALFIACTAVRAAAVVPRIEETLRRPVLSSNLATAWACLRFCGDTDPRPELGLLMTKPYPEG